MKKLLFVLLLAVVATRLYAQTPKAVPKRKAPANKVDTAKTQDNMPIIKLKDNSKMPVAKPQDNSRMPVLNPDAINKVGNKSKPAPKPQR